MIIVEKATRADCAVIAMIHTTCWAEVYSFIPKSVHQSRSVEFRFEQWLRVVEDPGWGEALYVVRLEGQAIGFGFAKPSTEDSIEALGELHAAYLLKPYRGGVAGPMLMKEMLVHLIQCELEPVSLWAFDQNKVRISYRAFGWQPVLRRDRVIAGEGVPETAYIHPDVEQLIDRIDAFVAKSEVMDATLLASLVESGRHFRDYQRRRLAHPTGLRPIQ